jgi:hypothetical protein
MGVISPEEKGLIHRRVKCVGVPAEISDPIVHLFFKWADSSGIEWAVQRLKMIKIDFLRKKAGLSKSSSWIKSGKENQFFGGPFGSLENWCFDRPSHFGKTVHLLNLYTTFFSDKITSSQAKKFVDGVTASAVPLPPEIIEEMNLGIQLSGIKAVKKLPSFAPLLSYNPSPSKRAPTPLGSVPEESGIVDSLGFLDNDAGLSHLIRFYEFYKPILLGLEPEMDYLVRNFTAMGIRSNPIPQPGSMIVGRIGLIQEAGLKLRAVANPGRIFQRVMEPFGKVLYNLLKTLPWDCTFQQNKADIAISTRLQSGKKVHSVDLSGATDYFPLDLQEIVLRRIFLNFPQYTKLFIELSRSEWSVPKGFPRELTSSRNTLKWSKGQPLGLFPSFASFAISHGLLLLGLLGCEYHEQFFILGDDVVILDDELYMKYRAALDKMKCPVSESKTISSSILAEFRSILFTKDEMIFQFKWRRISDDSFMDIIRSSPHLYPLLLPRQRKVVDIVAGLPSELGGLGWNPKGLPLSSRLDPFMSMIISPYEPKERLMGYNRQISELLYLSKISKLSRSYQSSAKAVDVISVLDQRAVFLTYKLLGDTFVPLYEILGENLDKILDGDIDLPILGTRELSKVSRLQRWESTLGKLGLLKQEG